MAAVMSKVVELDFSKDAFLEVRESREMLCLSVILLGIVLLVAGLLWQSFLFERRPSLANDFQLAVLSGAIPVIAYRLGTLFFRVLRPAPLAAFSAEGLLNADGEEYRWEDFRHVRKTPWQIALELGYPHRGQIVLPAALLSHGDRQRVLDFLRAHAPEGLSATL